MINTLLLIIIGIFVGIFVIGLGGGGGAIYLGVLSAFFGLAPASASATSIITALPALVMGSWTYYRKGMIDLKLGNRIMIASIPSILVGFFISPFLPRSLYQALIGVILILLGLQIIIKLHHGSQSQSHQNNSHAAFGYGILAGLMVGVAGLSGGGPITAGLLLMGASMATASATSSYVLVGMSVVGALLHLTSHNGSIDWGAASGLIIGSFFGAILAPSIIITLTKVPKRALIVKLILGLLIIFMGVKTLLSI